MTTQSHHDHVEKQFSSQASEYLTSTVHASGRDLQRLAVRLADYPDTSVLDMGCGAGHASFVAAQNVSAVVAYDLSAQMLDVVAQAAEARQLKNITTRQGYWICPYISRHLLSLNPLQARCRRYSRG
ncbi:class I SAM-dependent methyltransferase, partial [Escherichia coli]|uniref:class I SAM-dependent methyltransferase n=1 Tax=Escherichia coli TaxID=562 RepID=UPI001FCF0C2F